ncbi:MAG: restriction endonuclease subunit S [Fervidicoccus sp.]|nr:MAG: restriction endonuclease subunit S [Fervidicoccus sp.]
MADNLVFYKETEFKDTEIGRIPKEWEVARVTDVAEYVNGYAFSPKDWKSSGIPIIRIQNLNDPSAEFNYFDGEIDRIYEVTDGDLLFSWSASIGVYIWKRGRAVLNQHIFKVIPKGTIDKIFLYYVLTLAIGQLKERVHGSTMKHFKRRELNVASVPLPPLPEQQKIATILSTIDEAIQKTDEVIAKTERLKKGMMRELLTKGIGHKEFKDTEIGRIPKEWEVVNLEGACVEITDGSHWSPKQVERSEHRIATVANLRETYVDIDSCKFISEEDYMRLVKEGDVPRKDDILFSKDGTIGIAFTFKQDSYKIGLLSSIAIIRPNHELLFSDFGAYALKSPNILMQITGWKTGTALRRIILDSLKRLKIMLPPLHEQRRIASILLSADDRLELLRKERTKLERIKKGFMNELLTGRIRVGVRS